MKKQYNITASRHGININNAGLVLANNFIKILFESSGITADNKFLNATVQGDAVHYLQYLVTGLSNPDETFLPLYNLLCGLPPQQPVPAGIEIPESHIELIEELIKAIIGYWPSIGKTSVDGFRTSFLARDGILSEQDDKWELTVERKTHDVLLNTFPFSFSLINYPWMNKPLYVNWS